MADIFDEVLAERKNAPSGDIFDEVISERKQKGGEQTDEQSKPQANSDRYAERGAVQQVNAPSQGGPQPGKEPTDGNQQVSQRNINASEPQPQKQDEALLKGDIFDEVLAERKGGENIEKNAKTESQRTQEGKEDGKGIRGQGDARKQAQVTDREGGVPSPSQGFFEELKTEQGKKAGLATLIEEGIKAGTGTVAATLAEAALIPEEIATGGIAALAAPAVGMLAFEGGSELADKIFIKPTEKLLGISQGIEEAKQAAPSVSKVAGYAAMAPFLAKSVIGYGKAATEAAGKALEGEGVKAGAKAIGKRALAGAVGGVAFEPIRYGFESTEKGLGITDEEAAPITRESLLQSALTGSALGGAGFETEEERIKKAQVKIEKEKAKSNLGEEIITDAGLPLTAQVAGVVKTDKAIDATEKAKEVISEPVQERIGAAAWKNERTGAIYHGASHEEAVAAARRDAQDPENKDKVAVGDLPKVDVSKPQNRESSDFGFITKDGRFVSREEAERIGGDAGQLRGEKARDLLHSHEIELDYHKGNAQEGEVRQLPGAASSGEFDRNRVSNAAEVLKSFEIAGKPLNLDNSKDYLRWREVFRRDYEKGTFESKEDLESIYRQAHEVNDLRKQGIPIPAALDQIGGKRRSAVGTIANRNAQLNEQRKSMGLPELMPMAGRSQDSIWQEALYRIESSKGQYTENLLSELKANPNKAINGVEQAAISHRIAETAHERDMILDRAAKTTDPKIKADLESQLRNIESQIDDLSKVSQKAGNTWSDAGRMRAAIIANDFSLPTLLNKRRKAVGGRDLTKEEIKEAGAEADAFKKKEEEVKKAEEDRIAGNQDEDISTHIDEGIKEHKKTSVKREKGQEKNGNDLVAQFTEQLAGRKEDPSKLGSTIRNLAKAVARKRLEDEEAFRGRKLTEDEARDVTKTRDVVNDVHKIITEQIGNDWNIKQTRDAISGYGVFKNPSKSYLSQAISRIVGENRNIGKIEDIIQGLAPKKTGTQRLKPGANERMLIKRVNELARRFNVKAEDPEKQLATALNSAKTRATNLIAELEEIYRQGRPLKETEGRIAQEDPDLNDLKGEILGLKALIEEKYGKQEVPYEKKVKALESVYDKLIERYQKEIQSGEISGTSSKGQKITSKKLEHQREVLKNLRQERSLIRASDSLRQEQNRQIQLENQIEKIKKQIEEKSFPAKKGQKEGPKSSEVTALENQLIQLNKQKVDSDWFKAQKEAVALQAYKTRTDRAIEDAKRRLAEGDFSKAEKKETKLDEEARKKRLELQELKDQIQQNTTLKEYQNRTKAEKAIDAVVKFKRAAVLSYLGTIVKLGASSIEIPLLRAPSAAVGYALGKTPLFREIYRKSRQEAGGKIDKDIAIYSKGLWEGIKEFKKLAVDMKRSNLDLEYGDGSLITLGALDRPGKIHEAIKNPTKLANYKLAFERYLDWAKREGITIDESVKEKAGIEAYKEANSSIFMQDNKFVNKFNLFVTTLRKSDSPRQRALGLALQEMLPIVKIPTNIIKEAFDYQFGALTGGAKLIKEMNKGLENISPEDADMIIRQIKKGSVGLMGLAIGAALPDFFGGFYRKGADKDEEGPDYGGIKVGSQIISKQLLHHPAFVPFQIGATIRKVWEEAAADNETLGDDAGTILRGAWEAQMGLIEELPFLSFSRNVGKYTDPTRIGETAGEIAKSNIPGFLQEFAQYLDRDENGKVIKRKPEDLLQHIELGLPVLRQKVEEK